MFEQVLVSATNLATDVPGWKHGVPLEIPNASAHLVHVKHPYAWLLSMERWWSLPGPIDRSLVRMHARWDARDAIMRAHATRLDAYAGCVQAWLCRLPSEATELVRYEDVLRDVGAVVERVVETAGGEIVDEPRLPGARVDSQGSKRSSSFDPTYYTQRTWVEEFHPNELEELGGYLEETGYGELFTQTLGYEMDV